MNARALLIGAVQLIVLLRSLLHAKAKHRLKGNEGPESPVVPEAELVDVRLRMLLFDSPVMRSLQPCFEIAEFQMDKLVRGVDNRLVLVDRSPSRWRRR